MDKALFSDRFIRALDVCNHSATRLVFIRDIGRTRSCPGSVRINKNQLFWFQEAIPKQATPDRSHGAVSEEPDRQTV